MWTYIEMTGLAEVEVRRCLTERLATPRHVASQPARAPGSGSLGRRLIDGARSLWAPIRTAEPNHDQPTREDVMDEKIQARVDIAVAAEMPTTRPAA